jgi:membrane carboxypeptidase/penicillin-binding protein PbpC
VNEKGKVMDVHGGVDAENRQMIVWNKHGKINQQFDIIYVDEYPKEPKKGELNKDFGLYVERDFYVVSELSTHRYLDLINNRNFVIKVSNGRNTQRWYFDQKSLTIKTRLNNQSWDIKSAGKTRDMQVWSTNSGWFQIFKYVSEGKESDTSSDLEKCSGNKCTGYRGNQNKSRSGKTC